MLCFGNVQYNLHSSCNFRHISQAGTVESRLICDYSMSHKAVHHVLCWDLDLLSHSYEQPRQCCRHLADRELRPPIIGPEARDSWQKTASPLYIFHCCQLASILHDVFAVVRFGPDFASRSSIFCGCAAGGHNISTMVIFPSGWSSAFPSGLLAFSNSSTVRVERSTASIVFIADRLWVSRQFSSENQYVI